MIIFVCSPFGGKEENLVRARRYCRKVVALGHTPFAPHLLFPQFLNEEAPAERKIGIDMGLDMLDVCHEMWVWGTPTKGMRQEIAVAKAMGLPIKYQKTG